MPDQPNTIGENIRRARVAAGLSQHKLAVVFGTTANTVYRWEAGVAAPSTDTLRRVAEALGTTLAALVAEPPEQES